MSKNGNTLPGESKSQAVHRVHRDIPSSSELTCTLTIRAHRPPQDTQKDLGALSPSDVGPFIQSLKVHEPSGAT